MQKRALNFLFYAKNATRAKTFIFNLGKFYETMRDNKMHDNYFTENIS